MRVKLSCILFIVVCVSANSVLSVNEHYWRISLLEEEHSPHSAVVFHGKGSPNTSIDEIRRAHERNETITYEEGNLWHTIAKGLNQSSDGTWSVGISFGFTARGQDTSGKGTPQINFWDTSGCNNRTNRSNQPYVVTKFWDIKSSDAFNALQMVASDKTLNLVESYSFTGHGFTNSLNTILDCREESDLNCAAYAAKILRKCGIVGLDTFRFRFIRDPRGLSNSARDAIYEEHQDPLLRRLRHSYTTELPTDNSEKREEMRRAVCNDGDEYRSGALPTTLYCIGNIFWRGMSVPDFFVRVVQKGVLEGAVALHNSCFPNDPLQVLPLEEMSGLFLNIGGRDGTVKAGHGEHPLQDYAGA